VIVSRGMVVASEVRAMSGPTPAPSGIIGPFHGTPTPPVMGPAFDLYQHASYAEMYRRHNWVYTVVDYRAHAVARLPLKVYRRVENGREDLRDHPMAALLRRPNPQMDRNLFWRTVIVHLDLFGEAILRKVRANDGRILELWPMHPSFVKVEPSGEGLAYQFVNASGGVELTADDVIHVRSVDPMGGYRGVSPLEPLRRTLENEESARLAQASFWKRGARPGMALTHPGQLSAAAQQRLKAQFDAIAAGAANTGSTVVLEEGMAAQNLGLSAEEAQYIQTRELNAVEVIAAYHLPPTAVGILTHATYSNVTEQLRSVYRDTVAPLLQMLEAALNVSLRPEFGDTDDVYAEFVLDEVLRGAFEDRVAAIATAISSGQMTPAEARQLENRPFIEGSDQLLVNAAVVPVASVTSPPPPVALEPQETP
jgi:HK97 family phage portal protein